MPVTEESVEKPMLVNASAIPDQLGAIIRIAIIAIASSLITKGWLPADSDVNQIAGIVLGIIGSIWALYKALSAKKKLVVAADAAPDSVAQVQRK